jgi:hypothetical protein
VYETAEYETNGGYESRKHHEALVDPQMDIAFLPCVILTVKVILLAVIMISNFQVITLFTENTENGIEIFSNR